MTCIVKTYISNHIAK